MVFRPKEGTAQLIVLGSTRLDSYYLDTGEQRWWMPIGSGGSLGTPVAVNDTLFVSTLGSTEPYMPTFEAVLAMYDKDHDGRLSREEFKGDKEARSPSSRARQRGNWMPKRCTGASRRICPTFPPRWSTETSTTWFAPEASLPRSIRRRAGC